MNAITTPEKGSLSLQQVEHMKASLPPLSGQYPRTNDEAEATRVALKSLSRPAEKRWIAQSMFTLLSHYFVTETHPDAMEAQAKAYTTELKDCPQWAIEDAIAWWLSRHNPKRRNKPLPGDISEVAYRKMAMITFARQQIKFFDRYGNSPPSWIDDKEKNET